MATTVEELREWFLDGVEEGATHMIIVVDKFDWEDFPVYVMPGEDPRKIHLEHFAKEWETVMEVYNLKMDMETQLKEYRAHNF